MLMAEFKAVSITAASGKCPHAVVPYWPSNLRDRISLRFLCLI